MAAAIPIRIMNPRIKPIDCPVVDCKYFDEFVTENNIRIPRIRSLIDNLPGIKSSPYFISIYTFPPIFYRSHSRQSHGGD
jgi:hypothetical protein